LKLPQLLSQYLYQTRKMDLPGIGSFTLDADAVIPQETDRLGQVAATGIRFRNAVIRVADDALVNFIKEHTGKMKSLAASDLDFFLTTGRQLLNIGKPFTLDGIGTLVKNKEGALEFAPGDYMLARPGEPGHGQERERERRGSFDEPPRERDRESKGNSTKQGVLLVMIVVGLVVIGWGGYYLYKRNSLSEPAEKNAVVIPETPAKQATDTTRLAGRTADSVVKVDSAHPVQAPAPAAPKPTVPAPTTPTKAPATAAANLPVPPGAILYHFIILSTDNKHRALRRYNQLLGYQLNIKMDQKDSASFKLYFSIPAMTRDTAYIKDSLSETYAAPNVTIEH
jgi:hypothetical protein